MVEASGFIPRLSSRLERNLSSNLSTATIDTKCKLLKRLLLLEGEYMKKYVPSILIWKLEIYDWEELDYPVQTMYFLFHTMAKRFWKKHEEELSGYKVTLGGEQLWFW